MRIKNLKDNIKYITIIFVTFVVAVISHKLGEMARRKDPMWNLLIGSLHS